MVLCVQTSCLISVKKSEEIYQHIHSARNTEFIETLWMLTAGQYKLVLIKFRCDEFAQCG